MVSMIVEPIIEAMRKGTIPWVRPWIVNGYRNLVTKREYRGINPLLLALSAARNGFTSSWWLTLKQVHQLGGRVKDEHFETSTVVVFFKWAVRRGAEDDEAAERFPVLRYYRVYNLDQCEGIPAHRIPAVETRSIDPHAEAERILSNMHGIPSIRFGGNVASYSPGIDVISMPDRTSFTSQAGYYSTLFHELAHSTGHESRLNRESDREYEGACFGSAPYAREELIAEIAAAALTSLAGMEFQVANHAAYVASWLRVFENDPKVVITAAQAAQKAVDWILGVTYNKKGEKINRVTGELLEAVSEEQ
jgi:antirestriction protein ArdC